MINENLIIMSLGILLTLIGAILGVIILMRSAGILKKVVLFLTIGMTLSLIYHLINLLGFGLLVLGNYEYLTGIIYIADILFFVLAMVGLERMINRIDGDISKEKFQRKKK
jgi:hypothetical protein